MNIKRNEWTDEKYKIEVCKGLVEIYGDLFDEVYMAYKFPLELKSFTKATQQFDKAIFKAKAGNSKDFKLSKSFALKAIRDCYQDIGDQNMYEQIDTIFQSHCRRFKLEI